MGLSAVLMPVLSCSWPSALVLRLPLSAGESTRLSVQQLVLLVTSLCPASSSVWSEGGPGAALQSGVRSDPIHTQEGQLTTFREGEALH